MSPPPSTPPPQDQEPSVNGAGTTSSPSPRRGEDKSAAATPAAAVAVGRISFCGHPELHGTLCTSCGRNVLPTGAKANGGKAKGGRKKGGAAGIGGAAGGRGAGGREEGDGDHDHDDDHVGDTHQVLMKGGKMMSVTAEGASVRPSVHRFGLPTTQIDRQNSCGANYSVGWPSCLLCVDDAFAFVFFYEGVARVGWVPMAQNDGTHGRRISETPRKFQENSKNVTEMRCIRCNAQMLMARWGIRCHPMSICPWIRSRVYSTNNLCLFGPRHCAWSPPLFAVTV